MHGVGAPALMATCLSRAFYNHSIGHVITRRQISFKQVAYPILDVQLSKKDGVSACPT